MNFLILFGIPLVATIVVLFISFWFAHIIMVNDNTKVNGWGNYKKFKEQFNKVDWKYEDAWKWSLFSKGKWSWEDGYSEIHASIFKFNGIGMKMWNPIDYLLATIYVHRYIRKNYLKDRVHKW
jgi:hypothetical protein